VKSGKDALEQLFKGIVPDLIILDILMPNMDGWETYGRIRAISLLHQVPIIFLSSISEQDEIDRAYAMGAADFVVKPHKEKELFDRINTVLEKEAGKEIKSIP
jgi:putative two-component system response regulator